MGINDGQPTTYEKERKKKINDKNAID